MIDQKSFYDCLQQEGVKFFAGVPDTLLNEFCLYVETHLPHDRHVIAANEGNAIALAAGYHLSTGTIALVYMQNSGIGNAMNPLLSLTSKDLYAIPMVLLIGWRGDPAITDHVQHKKQGELTPILLEDMGIPYRVIENDTDEALEAARWAVRTARGVSGPVALVAKRGGFEKGLKKDLAGEPSIYSMSRERAIQCILTAMPKDTIFVATTGRATRELYGLCSTCGTDHCRYFLNVGAMGHASSIATGIALAHRTSRIVCLDGDAAAIMHLGALTTGAKLKLPNLLHVVLNNGVHESVGGQPSAGFTANLTAIAEHAGYKTVGGAIETEEALRNAIDGLRAAEGPAFIDVRVRKGIRKEIGPLNVDHIALKNALMRFLNGEK